MEGRELQSILFNLHNMCTHIEISRKESTLLDKDKFLHTYLDVHRLLDLFIYNIIDEFKILKTFSKNTKNTYHKDTCYVLQPIFSYLQKFNSIPIKRNKSTAHYNRDRAKSFKPFWEELYGKRFATTNEEHKMIFNMVILVKTILENRYYEQIADFKNIVKEEMKTFEDFIMNENSVNAKEDTKPVIKEVNKRMNEKQFSFQVIEKETEQ